MRLSRGGNRQLNAALHTIAMTQMRLAGPGHTYYRGKLDANKTAPEARRCLKRRLARVVYQRLRADHARSQQPQPAAA